MSFEGKVKNLDELMSIIGPFPRAEPVIMCHGTFDLVHPGHVRHLSYAKNQASKLIVSVTCDAHVTKADYRPFVPEKLRAFNLAALECVNYVIIDDQPSPLKLLETIQPDYFVKGFEYQDLSKNPKTADENEVVVRYGGKMIFSPGDIIFSSSNLIETQRPNITLDKLAALMDSDNISFQDLHETIEKFVTVKALVLGDIIIDTYTDTSMIGGQTKTPTISVRKEEERSYLGGAGIVAKHMRYAGAEVDLISVLGDDSLAEFALKDLQDSDINVTYYREEFRPTVEKNAIVCNGYRLLKIDTLNNRPISEDTVSAISRDLSESSADVVLFSDFRHGIFNKHSIPHLKASISNDAFKVADSQVASRWGNILEFTDFDLITPNEREARFALGDQDSVIRPLALNLFNQARCKNLILTLGEKGVMGFRDINNKGGSLNSFFVLDSFATNVVDPVGAGDAMISYASLANFVSKNTVVAAIIGSIAASLACEYDGNVPVQLNHFKSRLEQIEQNLGY